MNWDLLLSWLSEKGRGTWGEFKAAHDWLEHRDGGRESRAWTVARDLSALGHLEISWEAGGQWCIAPTVLTLLPGAGRALLTGSRTRTLYDPPHSRAAADISGRGLLVDAVDDVNLYLDPWSQQEGPTTVTIAIESDADALSLARVLGVPYTYAVAEQLARLLPPLAAYSRTWRSGELLRGFDVEHFVPATCLWEDVNEAAAPGLYRSRTWSRQIYALKTPTGAWFRVAPEAAVYEVLRWESRAVLGYDDSKRELTVPGTAALPLLASRAATLCSGRVPRRMRQERSFSRVTYLNVTPEVAERVAGSLAQELIRV